MKLKLTAVCVIISLLLHSCHAQKLNVNWGPHSMMYLKGKHGRRFVPDGENSVLKLQRQQALQGLQDWYAALKGLHRLQSLDFGTPGHIMSSKKAQYLQER